MTAFSQGPPNSGIFEAQGPQDRPSAMSLLMAGIAGGAAISVSSYAVSTKLRTMMGMQRAQVSSGRLSRGVAGFAAHHLGGMAGAQVGRAAGSALGMGIGGMVAGPPGAAVGGALGGIYGGRYAYQAAGVLGRHAVGGTGFSQRVGGMAMRGLGVNAGVARGIAAGVRGAAVGGVAGIAVAGATMLAEPQPQGPAGDVANPQSIGLGMDGDGLAARRRMRKRGQMLEGAGVIGTVGRAVASGSEWVADTVGSMIPGVITPGQRRKMEARQGEMDAQVRVFDAHATASRMGNAGQGVSGGNHARMGDAGSTSLHMMMIARDHQVALDAKFEAEQHRKRMEGGIL